MSVWRNPFALLCRVVATTISMPRSTCPRDLEAPLVAGERIGTVRVSLDGDILAETALIARNSVAEAGFFSRMGDGLYLLFRDLMGEADADSPSSDAQTSNGG